MSFSLRWPTDFYVVTQPFGANPEYYRNLGVPAHEGIDIRAPYGSNVYACADGLVYSVYSGGAYGTQVRINHENGYRTIYAHLARSMVRVGQRVSAGELIGLADSTGNSTGSHLHLSLKKDGATANKETNYPFDLVDPTPLLVFPAPNSLRLRTNATSGLRVRKGPGLGYAILTTTFPHEVLITPMADATARAMLGKPVWMQVQTPAQITGYSYAVYLEAVTGDAHA